MTTDVRRTLLLLRKDHQVLLAMKKRGFGAGRWNGVGGKLEPGESIEQALVRECQEEINVTPTRYRKVAELDFYGGSTEEAWNMFVYAYVCDEWQGEPTETEEMAPKWYDISDIPYADMWQDDEHWLPLALNGKKVTGTFTFDEQDNLTSQDVQEVESLS
ncbi:MAG: 8-oxo-dGTP diphosphatase [Candidatus Saccharimonadales bacterium]